MVNKGLKYNNIYYTYVQSSADPRLPEGQFSERRVDDLLAPAGHPEEDSPRSSVGALSAGGCPLMPLIHKNFSATLRALN